MTSSEELPNPRANDQRAQALGHEMDAALNAWIKAHAMPKSDVRVSYYVTRDGQAAVLLQVNEQIARAFIARLTPPTVQPQAAPPPQPQPQAGRWQAPGPPAIESPGTVRHRAD